MGFPTAFAELAGILLSTYYGGRADVKIRREIRRILMTDFVSLYPSIAILIGLWEHIISDGFVVMDVTEEFKAWLCTISLDDFMNPSTWKLLNVIVKIEADSDILPVRALYDTSSLMRTIGVNELGGARLWYAAPDVVASASRLDRPPRVLKALRFVACPPQVGLRSVHLVGSDKLFDPYTDDFFRFVIERRVEVQIEAREAKGRGDIAKAKRLAAEHQRLSALSRSFDEGQRHLKVVANASYGFFNEMNAVKWASPTECEVYSYRGKEPKSIWLSKVEEPGPFFHPFVSTMITSGARLMIMILEALAEREGVEWMLCDTDSMAFARPSGVNDDDFVNRVERIRGMFAPLNPYRNVESMLKLEDLNFKPGTRDLEPLFGLAIAPKSWAAFNLDLQGQPILREAKQFILENYVAPYLRSKTEEKACRKASKVRCWQRDVWLRVILAFMDGHPDDVDLASLPNFDLPAARKLSVSTTEVEKHLEHYNYERPYRERIRPGGFLLSFTPKGEIDREYLAYEHGVDRSSGSMLPPTEEARRLYECACWDEGPWWDALRDVGGRIIPDLYWVRKLRRWKRCLEFADVPARLLAANKQRRSKTIEVVYGNIDLITQGVRDRTGKFDLTTSDVLAFFISHPKPPRLRGFLAQARENCYGWSNELRPLAPYDTDIARAVGRCFNAYGDRKVETWELQSYADVFKNFHRRPEYKYGNGSGNAFGETTRRRVAPSRIDVIGKETARYARTDQVVAFQPSHYASEGSLEMLRSTIRTYRIGPIALHCKKSVDTIRRVANEQQGFRAELAAAVQGFIAQQETERRKDAALVSRARALTLRDGVRKTAGLAGIQPGHLSEILCGRRNLTSFIRIRLLRILSEDPPAV